jgi:capsular polysaccharide biosynthesis protein
MEKKKLNESIGGILVAMLVVGLSTWIFKKLEFRFGNDVGLSDRVIDSFDDIYKDKSLVNELANILKQEGDLDELFDKIYKEAGKNTWQVDKSPSWIAIDMTKNYQFQPDAKRIANKLIKSAAYKNFSKKHNFDNADNIQMEKLFYFIVTQKDFKNTAKSFIIKTVDKSIDLIKKGKAPTALKLYDLIPHSYV